MDQIIATRSYLKDVIGLGANQVGTDCANTIIAEGLDDPANLVELSKYDGVKTLCQNVRRPAGTEPQPGWITPNPNPRNLTAPRVTRSGKDIPTICKQRLNIAAYGANIFTSVGRQVTAASLSRSRLREFNRHKQTVVNHNGTEPLTELSKKLTILKLLDQMPTNLREMLGVSKVMLSYVVQDDPNSPVPLLPLQPSLIWSL